MKSFAVSLFAAVALVALCSPYAAQAEPRLDPGAVHKTRVPLLGSSGISPSSKKGTIGGGGTTPLLLPASFSLSAYVAGSIITPTTTSPQAEEEIAVDPKNYKNLFAAISDFSNFQNITEYVYSSDDGNNWGNQSLLPLSGGFLVTADGQNWSANSDPTTGIDRNGNLYLCNLYIAIDANTGNVLYSGLYVGARSSLPYMQTDIHRVFPVDLTVGTQPDKPWMAVDNTTKTTSGNVYVTWSEFKNTPSGSTDMIDFSKSTNHGVTWSAPKQVSLGTQNGAVQGSQVAVGPDGTVYVVYEVFYAGNQRAQFLTKSTTPGGSTFTTPVAITPKFNELNIGSLFRTDSFASIAVGPNKVVYVLYSDQPGSTAQVEYIHSGASGAGTHNGFSAPVVINDVSTGHHFFPSVAVDSKGVIQSSWFDTRNSPSNPEFYDIYATYTKNSSAFASNARVTPTIIDSGTGFLSLPFIGDYAGIAAAFNTVSLKSEAHPVWTSGGLVDFPLGPPLFPPMGQLQTATLQVP